MGDFFTFQGAFVRTVQEQRGYDGHFEMAVFAPKGSDCWLWEGAADKLGYGRVNIGKHRTHLAHRIAYEAANGPIPKGQCVLHRCDTPACIRPSHLYLGTQKQNAADREERGRSPRGEARPNSKLTNEAVKIIREEAKERTTSLRGLGRRFGVELSSIRQVLSGRTWTHV